MKIHFSFILFFISCQVMVAQYIFDGTVSGKQASRTVYLSMVDDYRNLQSVNNDLIISKAEIDSTGYFKFEGNQLAKQQNIYKLHIDNCYESSKINNHFEGHCENSKSIVFIAKNNDTISFPLSFDDQIFCDVKSSNPKALIFIAIDELLEDMKYDYAEFDSKVNRDLNNTKWFKKLQTYGKSLDEPLAELYIFSFLADRNKPFHNYYLNDVKENDYYNDLLTRLQTTYPNSKYTKQYEIELSMGQFEQELNKKSYTFNYTYLLIALLVMSLGLNLWFLFKSKKEKATLHLKAKAQLTKQEQNVLDLMLTNQSNKAIAESLFVSLSTVKSHINNIYKKLNISSRDELKQLFSK